MGHNFAEQFMLDGDLQYLTLCDRVGKAFTNIKHVSLNNSDGMPFRDLCIRLNYLSVNSCKHYI